MVAKLSTRKELEAFLESLDVEFKPVIHVNGKDYPTAVVVVDFGAPVESFRLSPEQRQELTSKIHKFTKELVAKKGNDDAKELNFRVSSDSYFGLVFWSAIVY